MLIRLMTIYYSTAIISILNALPLIQYFIDFASIPLIDARQSLSKPSTTNELNLRIIDWQYYGNQCFLSWLWCLVIQGYTSDIYL